jgi:sugar O-acyltransferase (sialic acid O-acetyltransferase NeuD family)
MVGDLVQAAGHELLGYVDKDPEKLGRTVEPMGVPVTHLEDDILAHLRDRGHYPEGVEAMALGIGENGIRQQRMKSLAGLQAPPLVHPSATVSQTVHLGRGSVVFPHAVINAGAWIGEAVIVNSGAIIEHDCLLEAGVHVSPGATICGGVRIGELTWVGAGATIIHGLTLGAGAIVGAGSTVLQDVEGGDTVVGSPARCITKSDSIRGVTP